MRRSVRGAWLLLTACASAAALAGDILVLRVHPTDVCWGEISLSGVRLELLDQLDCQPGDWPAEVEVRRQAPTGGALAYSSGRTEGTLRRFEELRRPRDRGEAESRAYIFSADVEPAVLPVTLTRSRGLLARWIREYRVRRTGFAPDERDPERVGLLTVLVPAGTAALGFNDFAAAVGRALEKQGGPWTPQTLRAARLEKNGALHADEVLAVFCPARAGDVATFCVARACSDVLNGREFCAAVDRLAPSPGH
ncbi:MAG: hypothetical protein KBD01_16435 [Acidobacteria bacterium]|nr:hypothetical protein [Acidobacteriota bacterium]